MAKINGFELKNVKEFLGHEEEPLMQGNVYYKGKKVGFWSQDAWGGMDNLNIDYKLPKELREEINNKMKEYKGGVLFRKIDELYDKMYKTNIYTNHRLEQKGYEFLFIDLIQLLDHEKIYKKYSKKWNRKTIYIVYDNAFDMKIGTILKDKDKTFFEYNSLNDFIVGE